MPIPYRFNPMGKSNRPVFYELTVKPSNGYNDGVTGMGVRITPKWATGGYCSIDWGDGSKEDAVKSGTAIIHVYTTMDLFIIKIKGDMTQITFGGRDWRDAYNWIDCSENWDVLGGITSWDQMYDGLNTLKHNFKTLPSNMTSGYCMFRDCRQADFTFTSLPEGLKSGALVFYGCTNAQLPLTSLPEGLTSGLSMFQGCKNAEINLDTLVANAPADGWTGLTTIQKMFYNCQKVTGSRSAFLAKCPNVTNITDAFTGTNTTE